MSSCCGVSEWSLFWVCWFLDFVWLLYRGSCVVCDFDLLLVWELLVSWFVNSVGNCISFGLI